MNIKTCSQCGDTKSIENFGIQLRGLFGKRSKCKICVSSYNKSYHIIRYIEDLEYKKRRIAQASIWVAKNPEARAIIAKKRNAKASITDKIKISARALVNQRVRFGRMPRASDCACFQCNEKAAHYHHHKGYDFEFRYDVVPVCHKCHILLH
jgi:hypothetical protein